MEQKISVIVPVYNAQNSLDRCIQSLLNQTYTNIEILLVNDGSRDNSLEICQRYAQMDPRIVVLDKPNGGVSSARNAGLDAAKGEFVMFCDSDDWVEPDWCQCMAQHYQPDGLTICQIAWDDESENTPVSSQAAIVKREEYMHYPDVMCSPVNKILSREVLKQNKVRFPELISLGEDFCFAMEYLAAIHGEICIVKRKLYHYDTSNDDSLSKRAPELAHCDRFYWIITAAMEKIGICDRQSVATRNDFVMRHYERYLIQTSLREDLSFRQKMAEAGIVGGMKSFYNCCIDGVKWGNPLYIWLFKKKQVHLVMLFLILRCFRDRFRDHSRQ